MRVGETADFQGSRRRVREWDASGDPWASVLIVHGIAEHSGRYKRTGTLLAEGGVQVRSFDLAGFGESDGRRAFVPRWDVYMDEVGEEFERLPDSAPRVLLGHSMGGLIALDVVTSGRVTPALLVVTAPSLGANVPGWQRALAPVLGRLAPRLAIPNSISGDQLSRDPGVGERYFADPLVYAKTTARLGAELLAAMDDVRSRLARLAVPTLVLHGASDTVVPPHHTQALEELPGVERRLIPNLHHELLNEPEGPEIVADILAWIRLRLSY